MAYAPTHTDIAQPSLFSRFGAPLRTIKTLFDIVLDARQQALRVERLMQMSDEQLAARGLTRDGIVQHVMATSPSH